MNTNKKNNTILFTIFGIVLVIVVGLLVFFANRPKTTDNTASSTSTSSSQKVDYPTNYKLHDAVKNSTTALNDLTLPQLLLRMKLRSKLKRLLEISILNFSLNWPLMRFKISLFLPKMVTTKIMNSSVSSKIS